MYSKPVLAICVGMQALMTRSEENDGVACLDVSRGRWFFGELIRVRQGERLKVPHMGWNKVRRQSPIPCGTASSRHSLLFCAQLPRRAR